MSNIQLPPGLHLVKMPRLGQDMEEGTLVEWAKQVGDQITEGELLAVIETEKAEVAFEAPFGGFLVEILVEPGTAAATGAPLAWIADDPTAQPPPLDSMAPSPGEQRLSSPDPKAAPASSSTPARPPRRKPVSPLARRRAKELGVDLAEVEGTGPGGRVTEADILAAHRGKETTVQARQELSRMRRAIAAQMTKSAAIPQFHLVREIVIHKPERAEQGSPVTYTDLLLWATAQALCERRSVNASWVEGDPPTVRLHPDVNLGFAVEFPDGLIVPVIPDAASLSLQEIGARRRLLEERARGRALRPDDVAGGTFTVSNLGGAGVDEFTALLNPPEAGILAVGAVKKRPVVIDGHLTAAPTVRLTLTGDHRVYDGMEGARFLAEISDQLHSVNDMISADTKKGTA